LGIETEVPASKDDPLKPTLAKEREKLLALIKDLVVRFVPFVVYEKNSNKQNIGTEQPNQKNRQRTLSQEMK